MVSLIPALLFFQICVASAAQPVRHEKQHAYPVWTRRDVSPSVGYNQTSNSTRQDPFPCAFTPDFLEQAIKKNCTSYTESLETSATFLSAWERQQSIERFSNCSYHEIFTRFPQAPDGLYRFVFQNGQIVVATSLNGYDAAHYGPLPPVPPALASGEKSAAFLPVFGQALQSFFADIARDASCPSSAPGVHGIAAYSNTSFANSSTVTQENSERKSTTEYAVAKLYQAVGVASQQYTRCAIQKASDVANCTIESTKKLHWLPDSFFVYADAPSCDFKLWTFVSIGVSIALDAIWLGLALWLKGSSAFSWLLLVTKLAKGLGQPLVEAVILQRTASDPSAIPVAAVLKFLQPTPDPILVLFVAIYLSKGQAFQILAVDAVTTMFGLVMVLGVTGLQIVVMANPSAYTAYPSPAGSSLVLIGLGLAILPWLLVYALIGCFSVPFQLFFLLGIIEAWLFETAYCFAIAFISLILLAMALAFVGLTPIFAIWELGWIIRNKTRALKEAKEVTMKPPPEAPPEKPVFPLARFIRRRVGNTSTWKRVLLQVVFGLFVILSWVSFVGKWMFMVNVLGLAGDAYCPSGSKTSAFAGLGLRALMITIQLALGYTGYAL